MLPSLTTNDPVQRLKMALILGCMFTPAESGRKRLQEMANFMNINRYRTERRHRNEIFAQGRTKAGR